MLTYKQTHGFYSEKRQRCDFYCCFKSVFHRINWFGLTSASHFHGSVNPGLTGLLTVGSFSSMNRPEEKNLPTIMPASSDVLPC